MTEETIPDLARLDARKRAHLTYMIDVGRRIEWDLHNAIDRGGFIPPDWHEIARATPHRGRVKLTMRVEEDVVRFFRSMGKGHLTRMADVLKTYMHARLAGVVRGPETLNLFRTRERDHAGDRPAFGDAARIEGKDWEDLPAPEGIRTGPTFGEQFAEYRYLAARRDRNEKAAEAEEREVAKARRRADREA